MSSTRIVIIGAAGRMGRAITSCISREVVENLSLTGAVDQSTSPHQGQDMGQLAGVPEMSVALSSDLPASLGLGDVIIDFSFHAGIENRAKLIAEAGKCWVIGTTGLTEEEKASVAEAAKTIPVILAANMSLGVNLLADLVKQAAASLKGRGYDIEVIEHHHRKKLDAPSGTALFLGEAAAEGAEWNIADVAVDGRTGIQPGERPEAEIGFHAVRGGDVVGDHDVIFAAEGELLKLSHRATSRDTFAIGALQATAWIHGKGPGLYSMRDVLGL